MEPGLLHRHSHDSLVNLARSKPPLPPKERAIGDLVWQTPAPEVTVH
jgi:hypothetical protein